LASEEVVLILLWMLPNFRYRVAHKGRGDKKRYAKVTFLELSTQSDIEPNKDLDFRGMRNQELHFRGMRNQDVHFKGEGNTSLLFKGRVVISILKTTTEQNAMAQQTTLASANNARIC
jgi:hypothetical protein